MNQAEAGAVGRKRKGWMGWVIVIVVILVVGVAAYFGIQSLGGLTPSPATPGTASASDYQAVFLVNNQVYFGKIANSMQSQFVELGDIYYLQVQQQIQPATGTSAPSQNVSLVKLGAELHGPTDLMHINRDQIVLIEDLRADSNIVKAIENYKAGQSAGANQ